MPTIAFIADDTPLDGIEHAVLITPTDQPDRFGRRVFRRSGDHALEAAPLALAQAIVNAEVLAAGMRAVMGQAYPVFAFESTRAAVERALAEPPPARPEPPRKPTMVRKQPRPDPELLSSDSEAYCYAAVDPIDEAWRFDDPEHRAALSPNLNADQLALFAVWMVDGEIDNGGIVQAIWNSPGELCEEAVGALRHLGMPELAALLDEGLSRFERPIPASRPERKAMLARIAAAQGDGDAGLRQTDLSASFASKGCAPRVADVVTRYFERKRTQPDMLDLMARFIDAHWESFFEG